MFPTGAFFEALRLEPYLRATGRRHPALAGRLDALADRTAATRRRAGPWRRQPEEHHDRPERPGLPRRRMRLVRRPGLRPRLLPQPSSPQVPRTCLPPRLNSSRPSTGSPTAYLARRGWEPRADLEARVAALLPGLFLARVDGKSPVEYVTGESSEGPRPPRRRPLHRESAADARGDPRRLGRRDRADEREDRQGRSAAASGIRAAARRSRPRSSSPAARPAAPSRPPAPRPARARRSTAATAAPRFGGYDVTGAVAAVNGEIAAALAGLDVTDQEALDNAPDRARRHAEQVAPRRQRHDRRVARRRPCRGRGGAACRSGSISPATGRRGCRCPRSSSSAAAPTPRAASTSRISWSIAVGAATFAEALDMTAEVYRAAGALLAEAGQARRRRRRGRLLAGLRHQRGGAGARRRRHRAGRLRARQGHGDLARRRRVRIRQGRPLSPRPRAARARQRRHDRHAPRLARPLSDRLDRGSARRGRRGGPDRLHQGRRPEAADRRRRLSRHQRRPRRAARKPPAPAMRC